MSEREVNTLFAILDYVLSGYDSVINESTKEHTRRYQKYKRRCAWGLAHKKKKRNSR